jgi:hypothetical protein
MIKIIEWFLEDIERVALAIIIEFFIFMPFVVSLAIFLDALWLKVFGVVLLVSNIGVLYAHVFGSNNSKSIIEKIFDWLVKKRKSYLEDKFLKVVEKIKKKSKLFVDRVKRIVEKRGAGFLVFEDEKRIDVIVDSNFVEAVYLKLIFDKNWELIDWKIKVRDYDGLKYLIDVLEELV